MNDSFSTINAVLRDHFINRREYNNIYFQSPTYELTDYFDISNINYINKDSVIAESDYDFVIKNHLRHSPVGKWIGEEYHIKNFIQIKKEILEKHDEYRDYIGIHLRVTYAKVMSNDKNRLKDIFEKFLNEPRGSRFPKDSYIQTIKKIIHNNKKVCIFSDTDGVFDYLPIQDGIIHEKPGCLNMENKKNRNIFLEKTIHDLVKMGKCKELYVTKGNFWQIAGGLVNEKLIVKKLQNYLEPQLNVGVNSVKRANLHQKRCLNSFSDINLNDSHKATGVFRWTSNIPGECNRIIKNQNNKSYSWFN